MLNREHEHREVLEKIFKSKELTSPGANIALRKSMLTCLFENSHEPLNGNDLAKLIGDLGPPEIAQQIFQLRGVLERYAESREGRMQRWRCELPKDQGGYQMRFALQSARYAFWLPHLDSDKDVAVVCNEPVFFRKDRDREVTRYVDVNPEDPSTRAALAELRRQRPELGPDLDREQLEVSYGYMLSGEVQAREAISSCFAELANKTVRLGVSNRMSGYDLGDSSPILLGNAQINKFMRELGEGEWKHFCYNLVQRSAGDMAGPEPQPRGHLLLRRASREERKALPQKQVRETNPPRAAEGAPIDYDLADDENATMFVIVSRVRNPVGQGVITCVQAHRTRALAQTVRTLTDETRMRALAESMNLDPFSLFGGFPKNMGSFEILLSVRMKALGSDIVSEPQLVGWRAYDLDGQPMPTDEKKPIRPREGR